ncbi:MAG: SGNH/GDSL hydrolase family protein [Rhodospirillales bacterium]|nr:SGNH/GDSL hydrolase family protein [Rhodospirillales bacterium]
MNSDTKPSAGKQAVFVAILIVAPLLLLAGLELVGRAAISVLYGVPGKSYGLYKSDPVLGHYPAPNTYNQMATLNDGAFRNVEDVIEPRPAGALRIIAYGGSTTFCPSLATAACWPSQFEKQLRASDGNPHHQVLNGGVVLWSLGHVLERIKRDLPKFGPDMVIVYSGINEAANANSLAQAGTPIAKLVAAGHYGVAAANYPASEWLHLHSLLFKVARYLILRTIAGEHGNHGEAVIEAKTAPQADDPAVMQNYLVVLGRTIKQVRDSGAEPVFVIQASTKPMLVMAYSVAGGRKACEMGVRVLDAREAVAVYPGPIGNLFDSSIHYSAKGATVLAEYLYDRLFARQGYSACDRLN